MSTDPAVRPLSTPIAHMKYGGAHRAEKLHKQLRLRTAADLLFFFPRDYDDFSEIRTIGELEPDQRATFSAVVEECELRELKGGKSILGVLLREGEERIRCVWFNQPFLQARFPVGQRLLVSGSPKRTAGRLELVHPKVKTLAGDAPIKGQLLPIYSLTEGVNQAQMRRLVQSAVDEFAEMIEEVFPEPYLAHKEIFGIGQALHEIHQPTDADHLERARRRFIYQELLILQLALAFRRRQQQATDAIAIEVTPKIDARIRRRFPFPLTEDQDQAVAEIVADLARPHPMNRLLQGEVGSGKTVVAEYAMLAVVALGRQAVMMAPTDVLARQHSETLARDLAESKVRIGLLTGSLTAAKRRKLIEQVQAGEIDLLVGTQAIFHALAKGELVMPNLSLVIIDEQHKFGVRQRAELKQRGVDAHYLVMTATPIPRTVAISLFGDLDVSALRNPPPGRQPVNTYITDESQRDRWWKFYREKLDEGRQGYVIAPLVEDNDEDVASLQAVFEQLAADRLESYRLDLLHGRMSGEEKAAVMQAFRDGRTQVLVATSVVEVGVDVPNATLMAIENGERFGLAQLHQLRGRISRGSRPGYLAVFSNAENREATQRLDAFAKSNDGFELSEIDFQLRGPGDIFGVRQHGLPPLRIADLQRDAATLEEARRDAMLLTENDPQLQAVAWSRVRDMVLRRFGAALDLSDVG